MKLKIWQSSTQTFAEKAIQTCLAGTLVATILLFFSSCVENGPTAAYDHGPFDKNGNYIEEWADNSSYSKSRNNPPVLSDLDTGMVAAHETPLPNATTAQPAVTSTPSSTSRITSKPKVSTTVKTTTSKPKATTAKTTTSTKPKATAARTTTKPKVAIAKPKPKSKPTSRVVIKKGDTLYELALRHKTSVSAIQKANGIRGTVLQIGKSLVIPK
jgi:LysM repeat protein